MTSLKMVNAMSKKPITEFTCDFCGIKLAVDNEPDFETPPENWYTITIDISATDSFGNRNGRVRTLHACKDCHAAELRILPNRFLNGGD